VTFERTDERLLDEFSIASAPGNERLAMCRVADAVNELGLGRTRLENLKTGVAEATLNAMEHGHHFQPDRAVVVRVALADSDLVVTVIDTGGPVDPAAIVTPDLEAKLSGRQSSRGWGLFLIRNMVDEVVDESEGALHQVHLRMHLA
jgi:anti-sigma regulatory factor (Ser/Thr protein kinase)